MGRERTKGTSSAGAMTRAMMAVDAGSTERVLRIGRIEGSQLREERIFRERHEITVGRHEKSTFVTADASAPGRFAMFVPEASGYRLHFTDAMDGRIARPEGVTTLHALRDAGRARRETQGWSIALDLHARGKVTLPGGESILFQFVPAPPPAPRPQLPVAIRSRPLARTDWTYNACLAGFLFAAFAGVSYVEYGYDPIVEDEPEEVANTVRLVMPPTSEDPPPAPTETPSPTEPETPREAMNARPVETPSHHDTPSNNAPHTPASHRPSAEDVAAQAIAQAQRASDATFRALENNTHFAALVGVRSGAGGVTDVLANGAVMNQTVGDLAQAGGIDNDPNRGIHRGAIIANNNIGRSDQLGRGHRVDNGATIDTGTTTQLVARAPTGRITVDRPDPRGGTGDIPIDDVASVVRRGLSGLQWCYTSGLRNHPTLQGRVEVGFTIGSSGRVTGTPNVNGFDEAPEVQQCLRSRFRGFVFPIPEGGTVDVSFPFHFVPGT